MGKYAPNVQRAAIDAAIKNPNEFEACPVCDDCGEQFVSELYCLKFTP